MPETEVEPTLSITGINAKTIESRVVEEMVRLLHHDAKRILEEEAKKVITEEIRAVLAKHVRVIVEEQRYGENGEFDLKEYVKSRVLGKRGPDGVWARPISLQERIDRIVYSKVDSWFHEFVRPHLDKVKEEIRSQLLDKILRESTYDDRGRG